MTTARSKQVDASVTRWYHCISRCVRRAFLLGEGDDSTGGNRKIWIENRLKELADIFAISVGGFAVMDNHLHVLARLDPWELRVMIGGVAKLRAAIPSCSPQAMRLIRLI